MGCGWACEHLRCTLFFSLCIIKKSSEGPSLGCSSIKSQMILCKRKRRWTGISFSCGTFACTRQVQGVPINRVCRNYPLDNKKKGPLAQTHLCSVDRTACLPVSLASGRPHEHLHKTTRNPAGCSRCRPTNFWCQFHQPTHTQLVLNKLGYTMMRNPIN